MDKRKPMAVLLVRLEGQTTNKKFEIFEGSLFPWENFTDCQGNLLASVEGRYRVRLNNIWLPRKGKFLYTRDEVLAMLGDLMKMEDSDA